jgi:erythronate-4-phosphate dehydrogenase
VRILLDENIPLGRKLFGTLGEVTSARGREVDEDFPELEKYDILAIRSVTRVTPSLVDRAARCRVIATATIGTDHIDDGYIEQVNNRRATPITVISAPGSNAESVADYVWFALAHLTGREGTGLSGRSLGIIGCGNCGSRVARRARGFDVRVLRNDPPRAERDPDFVSDPLDETLQADFVTLHVPLTREDESAHPTHRMIGAAELARMRSGAYLLNSSRGAVVDSAALIEAMEDGDLGGVVLDVYEGEPEPREELIRLPQLATPHIAGYAVEAKRRGAVVIYEQTCRALGLPPVDTEGLLRQGFAPPRQQTVSFDAEGPATASADRACRVLLRAIHDIEATSRELKSTLDSPRRGELFDRMRKDYESHYGRHELACYAVGFAPSVSGDQRREIARRVAGFGMTVTDVEPNFVLTAEQALNP